jgi:hypothetical protein
MVQQLFFQRLLYILHIIHHSHPPMFVLDSAVTDSALPTASTRVVTDEVPIENVKMLAAIIIK